MTARLPHTLHHTPHHTAPLTQATFGCGQPAGTACSTLDACNAYVQHDLRDTSMSICIWQAHRTWLGAWQALLSLCSTASSSLCIQHRLAAMFFTAFSHHHKQATHTTTTPTQDDEGGKLSTRSSMHLLQHNTASTHGCCFTNKVGHAVNCAQAPAAAYMCI